MKITMREKLKMCKLHIDKKLSLSHVSEMFGGYDVAKIKYAVNLYKRHGEDSFLNRERWVYKRDTKLLAINQVLSGRMLYKKSSRKNCWLHFCGIITKSLK